MAQTVTIQRGQSTCQAQFVGQSSGGAGYPNGLAGGSVTIVTAPAAGVSRVILNQLTFVRHRQHLVNRMVTLTFLMVVYM